MKKLSTTFASLIITALAVVVISGCPSTHPPPSNFGITTQTKKSPTGGTITVTGNGFTPGGQYHIAYLSIPNRPGAVDASGPFPPINSSGTFIYQETFNCTSTDPGDANVDVHVNVRDITSGNFTSASTKASKIWVCLP